MKKSVLLVFVFCFSFLFSFSQTPDWVWARGAISGSSEGLSVATDSLENIYIAGVAIDTIKFGAIVLSGYEFTCIAKFDSSGNLKWAKGAGGPGPSYGGSISTDPSGNCYLASGFSGTISFDSITLISPGLTHIFVVKFDPYGNVIWAKNEGGTGSCMATNIASDSWGNVYVIGNFNTSITIGSFLLTNLGVANDIFLIKYDSSGNVIWAVSAGCTSDSRVLSVAPDTFGNIYITGYTYCSSMSFGSYTINTSGMIFLAKYDSLGNLKWAKSFGNSNSMGNWVTTDAIGNVYLTGDYNGGVISFGTLTLSYAGGEDAFLSKFDSSGNIIWAKNIGNTGNDKGYCLVADKCANIYMSGGSWNPVSPSLTFDTIPLLLTGGDPLFIAKFDSSGHALFAKSASSGGDDQNAIALTRSGNLYIGGDFWGSSFIIGSDTLVGYGENFFVAKLSHMSDLNCSTLLTAFFQSSATNICAEGNNCINFSDFSTGNPTSWQWHFPGATPNFSNQQNPDSICYSNAGTYPVTLIVTNASGSDTLTVSPMITVGSAPAPPVITMGGDTLYSSHASSYQWYFNGNAITSATDSFYVWHQGGTYSVQITDSFGCNSLSNGMAVGVEELIKGVFFSIYPNPFDETLTVVTKCNEEYQIALFDITSRELFHYSFVNSAIINTVQLARGIYFYEVRDKDGIRIMGKAVKE